ncbi:MAG: general stress protein [Cyanobacteriota bacterium]|nr:general stress protein [Cyanobacteriota bacterium]
MAINTELRRAVGVFPTRQEAESALTQLRDAGFNMDKVSAIAKNADGSSSVGGARVTKSTEEQAAGGAAAGAAAGGATGGVMGLIGGLGVLAIPGVGPVAEVGVILANTLLGGGIGAAGGGLLGALIGWGIPEDQARIYDERLNAGEYVILVEGTPAEIQMAETILNQRGIRHWGVYGLSEPARTNLNI